MRLGCRAPAAYGVEEEDLGAFYAQRTLLKREVIPHDVAKAISALASDEFARTTGTVVPVDSGVAGAFLR